MKLGVFMCGCCGISCQEAEKLEASFESERAAFTWSAELCGEPAPAVRGVDADVDYLIIMAGRTLEARGLIVLETYSKGIYPLNVDFVDVRRFCGGKDHFAKLANHLSSAIEAAEDFAVHGTLHLRPTRKLKGAMTRRSLLTFMRETYFEPLPVLEKSSCAAGRGCHLCARACPRDAISIGRLPVIETAACSGCFACVVECPTSSWTSPASSSERLLNRVRGWLRVSSSAERRLVLLCWGSSSSIPRSYFDVLDSNTFFLEVPCLRSVGLLDVLKLLSLGVPDLKSIRDPAGCDASHRCDGSSPALGAASALLETLGYVGMVEELSTEDDIESSLLSSIRGGPPIPSDLQHADTLHQAVSILAPDRTRLAVEALGAGRVEILPTACTLCGVCWERCPTEALTAQYEGSTATVTFDHESCPGCRICEALCPERAIAVKREVDLELLGEPVELLRGDIVRCVRCGEIIAPSLMLNKLSRKVSLAGVMRTHCPRCRLLEAAPQRGDTN